MIRSVLHMIHDGRGGSRQVKLTPYKAIRYFCMECMCGSHSEIEKCTAPLCPLFPYRMGTGKETDIAFPQIVAHEVVSGKN